MAEGNECRWVILIIGLVLLLSAVQRDISSFINRKYETSSEDGKVYRVVGSFDKSPEAADRLSQINAFMLSVLKHMKKKYRGVGGLGGLYTARLLDRYNPDVLRENNPRGSKNTSFVTNKGDEIAFCLREKSSGRNDLHDLQTLKFVSLHEMAHIMTESYGHDNEFWSNFKFLMREAVEAGLYTPVDYSKNPVIYCSLEIDYNPLYDNTLPYPSQVSR